MKGVRKSKSFRGFTEGGFVASATTMAVGLTIQAAPIFSDYRGELYVVYGCLVGAIVREVMARFLWRSMDE